MVSSSSANLLTGWINNQGEVALISAFLGALAGSISGYFFNKQLEKQKSKERYWIQRKNTIYSPIYKELLSLREYFSDVLNASRPLINVEFDEKGYGYFNVFVFSIWNSIKKDIRYDYVPANLKKLLDTLTFLIKKHQGLEGLINTKWKLLVDEFIVNVDPLLDREQSKNINMQGSIMNSVNSTYLPYSFHKSNEEPFDFIMKYVKNGNENEVKKLIVELKEKLSNVDEYKNIKPELKLLIEHLDETIEAFRNLITRIISTYEGGLNYE